MSEVLIEVLSLREDSEDSIALITLNRPSAKNAISRSLSLKLASTLADVRERKHVRCSRSHGASARGELLCMLHR